MTDRRKMVRTWTAERNALMRTDYATAPLPDLLARLNALPARLQVQSVDCLVTQAKVLGLRRTRNASGPRNRTDPAMMLALARRTPEREALLRQMRAALASFPAMLVALNALPGPPFGNWMQVRRWTRTLGLPVLAWSPEAPQQPPAARNLRKYTPERLALLRETVSPDRLTDWNALLAAVNALPGFPVETVGALRGKADRLELLGAPTPERRRALLSARARLRCGPPKVKPAKVPKVATPKPGPKPTAPRRQVAAAPPSPPAPVLLTPEAVDAKLAATQASVRAALARRDADCAALASRFRLPLREVIRLQGQVRAEGRTP